MTIKRKRLGRDTLNLSTDSLESPACVFQFAKEATSRTFCRSEMNYPHFVLIEKENGEGPTQYYVVHTQHPKMVVQFATEMINGQVKPGTLQRVSVPNSWAGEYSKYSKLLSKAEAFFRESLMSEPERVANRLKR